MVIGHANWLGYAYNPIGLLLTSSAMQGRVEGVSKIWETLGRVGYATVATEKTSIISVLFFHAQKPVTLVTNELDIGLVSAGIILVLASISATQ